VAARQREIIMRKTLSGAMPIVAIAVAAASAALSTLIPPASAQAPAGSGAPAPPLKTPWGEPDLQGIWTDETDTPLQRPPKYANQEFFTEAQRAEIDKARSEILGRERRAAARPVPRAAPSRTFPAPITTCSYPSNALADVRR
jgi:hypothetical protein